MRASLLAVTALYAASLGAAAAHASPAAHTPLASSASPTWRSPHQGADTTRRLPFDIPAQPLARALDDFARQAGVRVSLEGAAGPDARSAAVRGTFTAAHALRTLLAGTGHQARFADAHSVVVRAMPEGAGGAQGLDPVVVTAAAARRAGYAPRRSSSATRTDAPLRDVPQAVTVVGGELMADQAMQSMADVVRYIPGVTMGQGEGHRDAPTIRGTSSTADFFVDGVRDDAQYLRDVYNVDRVEALKGANALVFGRGGGGGVINRVTKDAQWTPTRAMTVEGGSFDHRRATLDVGQGIGRGAAARVNGMYEHSGLFRDVATLERQGVNPTAALLAGGTLVRVGYEYFLDRRTVDRGIPSFQGRPSNADVTTFFGDPDASRSRAAVHAAGVTVERGSLDGLLVRNRTRYMRYDKFYQNVFPGAVSESGADVSLAAYSNATDRRNLFNQTDVSYALATGPLRQTLLVGAELGRQVTDNFRRTGYFGDSAPALVVPFANPRATVPVTFRQSATDADNQAAAGVAAVYAQSQLALGARWQAVAGVRYDRFALRVSNRRSGEAPRRTDRMLSPRAGLVFKPAEPLSLYGSYSVSYLPSSGDQFSSLSASTAALEPERFTNRELGVKWEPRADLALTGAYYRLDRTNTVAPDPVDPTLVVQTGRQRTAGYEVGVSGNLTGAWQIAGGYAAQRATIVSRTAAAPPGATAPLVPHHTLSLWNRYQVTRRFGAGAGVVHQADMYAAINNEVTLPAFTRLDAAAYLRLSDDVRLQLNVENLLDERYYATSHGNNNIMPGASRTLRVSVTATP